MADFQPGDVVQLKSGGPKMTVQFYESETNNVSCVWFEKDNRKQSGYFAPGALVKVDETQGGISTIPIRK